MKAEIKTTIQQLRLTERLKQIQDALQKLKGSLQSIREKASNKMQ